MKKAQVTPIIIVAIVLVIGFGIYFAIPEGQVEKVDPSIEPIYNFVQGCLEENTKDAILEISKYGGYFNVPEDNFERFPYYVKNGRRLMPSTEIIGNEISEYVEIAMYFCVREFDDFPSFNVESNEIDVKTVINDGRIDFSVNYPLSIRKGDNNFEVKRFEESVDARLGKMIDLAEFLVVDQLDHPISLCITCGAYITETYEMDYNNINFGEGNFLHSISDSKIKIDNQPLEFNFAIGLEVGA